MNTKSVRWSYQQTSWLRALGYTLYSCLDEAHLGDSMEMSFEKKTLRDSVAMIAASPNWHEKNTSPQRKGAVTAAQARPTTDATSSSSAPIVQSSPGVTIPDRLELALFYACGVDASNREVDQLMRDWPSKKLRNNPAAKRALWPLVRKIRKSVLGNAIT